MVSDKEIQNVMDWWAQNVGSTSQSSLFDIASSDVSQKSPEKSAEESETEEAPWEAIVQEESEKDSDEAIIQEAIALVRKQQRASASFLQRQLRIGYPKAAWLIDQLEARGVIGEAQGGGREREILPEEDEETD